MKRWLIPSKEKTERPAEEAERPEEEAERAEKPAERAEKPEERAAERVERAVERVEKPAERAERPAERVAEGSGESPWPSTSGAGRGAKYYRNNHLQGAPDCKAHCQLLRKLKAFRCAF